MNYDGESYVKNVIDHYMVSIHDVAFVREDKSLEDEFLYGRNEYKDISIVKQIRTFPKDMELFIKTNKASYIPHTINVYDSALKRTKNLLPLYFNNVFNKITYPNKLKSVSVISRQTQPTNIKYTPAHAIVTDSENKTGGITTLPSASVNVNSKVELVIPESASGYTDMSLVIQKNVFVQIKVPSNASDVVNLPEDLTFNTGIIKGTFTKSGEYNIRIKYNDGEQIINIIVPYYQRLL